MKNQKRYLSEFKQKESQYLNSLALAVMAVNTRLVLTVGVNVHLTFGRENLIGKNKMLED